MFFTDVLGATQGHLFGPALPVVAKTGDQVTAEAAATDLLKRKNGLRTTKGGQRVLVTLGAQAVAVALRHAIHHLLQNRSPSPNEDRASPSPDRVNSEYSMSPQRAKSQSPAEANGHSRSPSPVYEQQSPADHDGGAAQGSPVVEGSPADGDEEN
ncbi:hypothetical protein L1987_84287 [Smallanthus sonchifolius]|uniref:Uncharacterized protein n=1 Tax=Smallanthus sonchifolius TaxID=185202 RepID=A0ACB8YE72_9ASTR|nr:hypothetical protein L1987_84287 [Smallanthus sonchifolius]